MVLSFQESTPCHWPDGPMNWGGFMTGGLAVVTGSDWECLGCTPAELEERYRLSMTIHDRYPARLHVPPLLAPCKTTGGPVHGNDPRSGSGECPGGVGCSPGLSSPVTTIWP